VASARIKLKSCNRRLPVRPTEARYGRMSFLTLSALRRAQDLTPEEDEQKDTLIGHEAVLAQVSAPPLSPIAANAATDSLTSLDLAFIRI
jgi:hypothetical protein